MNEEVIKKLVDIYSELETKLLEEIVSHFKLNNEFINSDYFRLEKLEELGLLNQNIVNYIAEVTKKTPAEIQKAMKQIGFEALNIDDLSKAYAGGKLQVDPGILMQSGIVDGIIKNSYSNLTDRFIELSKKIEAGTRDAYIDIVEKAYLQTSGGMTYKDAIRNALMELGNKGITTLTYKVVDSEGNVTGIRNYDVEGAVRRELVTAVHNLTNSINKTVAEELEVEYLYLSEHESCRPQHFPWQGTIIKRIDLVKVTRLGEVDGMGGPNCKHYPTPYFGNKRGTELKKISLEEATKQYELTQKQRYIERGIRKWKRRANIFETAEDTEYYKKSKKKIREWQLRAKRFTEDNSLRRSFSRENVEKMTKSNKSAIITECQSIIESKGIAFWKKDLSEIDSKLLSDNTNRLSELIEKYPTMQDFIKEKNVNFNALHLKGNTVAQVSSDMDMKNIEITLSKEKYRSYEQLVKMEEQELKVKHCMDRADKYRSTYTITHEFGHLVENKLIDDYNKEHLAEFLNMKNRVLNAKSLTQSRNILNKWRTSIADNIAQEIYDIALKSDTSLDLSSTLSEYGKQNSFEFFAESFANLECGKPNQLGKALGEYLKK